MKYNKLIRDKIPEKIMQSGKAVTFRKLNDDEYKKELENKLLEESIEFQESKSIFEIADIIEVLIALIRAYGFNIFEVLKALIKKRLERGGFKEKIFLEEVKDNEMAINEVVADEVPIDDEVKYDDEDVEAI